MIEGPKRFKEEREPPNGPFRAPPGGVKWPRTIAESQPTGMFCGKGVINREKGLSWAGECAVSLKNPWFEESFCCVF